MVAQVAWIGRPYGTMGLLADMSQGFRSRFTLGYFLFLPPGGPAVLDLQEQGGTDWKRKRFPIGSY